MEYKEMSQIVKQISQIPYDRELHILADRINQEEYDDFHYLLNNEKNITKEEWEKYYNKYKSAVDSPILQLMAKSPYTESRLIENMVEFLIKGENPKRMSMCEERDRTLMFSLAKIKNPKYISMICYYMESRLSEIGNFLAIENITISEKNKYEMAKVLASMRKELQKKRVNGALSWVLKNMQNQMNVRYILEHTPDKENIRTQAIQNEFISDDLRKEIYQQGIDPKVVNMSFLPKEIFDEIYESIINAFDSEKINIANYDKVRYDVSDEEFNAYVDAKNKIHQLIQTKALSPEREYELFLILKSHKMTKHNEIMYAILSSTTNPKILMEADEVKSSADRAVAYQNENMPQEKLDKKIEDILRIAKKNYEKKGIWSTSATNADILKEQIKQQKLLPVDAYSIMLPTLLYDNNNMFLKILTTPNIHNEVLRKIFLNMKSSNVNSQKALALCANMVMMLKPTLSDEEKKSFDNYIQVVGRGEMHDKSGRNISFKRLGYYHMENPDTIISTMQKVKEFMDDKLHKGRYVDTLTNVTKEVIDDMIQYANEMESSAMAIKTNNYQNVPDEFLELQKHEVSYYFSIKNHHTYEFTKNVEQFAEKAKPIFFAKDKYKEIESEEVILPF